MHEIRKSTSFSTTARWLTAHSRYNTSTLSETSQLRPRAWTPRYTEMNKLAKQVITHPHLIIDLRISCTKMKSAHKLESLLLFFPTKSSIVKLIIYRTYSCGPAQSQEYPSPLCTAFILPIQWLSLKYSL